MAISEVSSLRNGLSIFGSATSRNLAFGANVTAGQFLVVTGNLNGGTPTAPTVTDTVGTSYTVKYSGTTQNAFVAYGVAAGNGANTATITIPDSLTVWFVACAGFTGVHATPLDVDAGGSYQAATSAPTQNITTVAENALIIGFSSDQTGSATTAITEQDGTVIFEYENGAANVRGNAIFEIVTTATTYTINWDYTTSSNLITYLISFAPAASGGVFGSNFYRQVAGLGGGF